MSGIWTNELELTFLEYFQSEPILWNANLKDYKNKLKVHDAWKRISTLMEIPVDELKTKKNSLLASYRSYKNKVKKSEKSGAGGDDVYKPIWFAYELMDSFLADTTKCKSTINTETQSANSEDHDHEEHVDLEEDQSEQRPQADLSQRGNTNATTIRRRKNPTELWEAGRVMKEALSTFNATVKRNESQSIPKEDDDCDLYAKLLAKKLRRLPEDKRLTLMHAIDGMFLSSQYTIHSESSSPILTPSPQPQHANRFTFDLFQQRSGSSSSSCSDPIIQFQPRPGTSSSSHSEPIIPYSPMSPPSPQPQNANQIILSRKSSHRQFQPRHRTSSASYSKPIIQQTTPSLAPQLQHANPAINLSSIAIQNSNANLNSNVIIQSNDVVYPPVIHIPDQPNDKQNTDATVDTVSNNIIEKAFFSS